MTKHPDLLSGLPELPLEAFELSARLDYSDNGLAITNRFEAKVVERAPIPTPHAVKRSSHELKMYFAWVVYPHVVCTPIPEPEVMGRVALEPRETPPPRHAGDLAAIAKQRLFFKLSRFRGVDLSTPWGCEVRYGPWFGVIICNQSCFDGVPDEWALSSTVLDMEIRWTGGPHDMPSVPNLIVVWDPGQPASTRVECCPGFRLCNGSCLAETIDCPGHTPA